MRRLILLLTLMAATLVVASGLALAVNEIGTNGPDTLRGTNQEVQGRRVGWSSPFPSVSSAPRTCSVLSRPPSTAT